MTGKGTSYTIAADELIFDNDEGEYWKYEYDLLNRLNSVWKSEAGITNKQLIAEYTYDANNLRIKKTSAKNGDTWYIFSAGGSILCKETTEEKEQYIYVFGKLFAMKTSKPDGSDEQVYYYITNHLGTTEMVTDETGRVIWQDELSPFGESSGEIGIVHMRAKFTGKDLDEETGLFYYNARWMSPELGRFISVDPVKDGENWYVYGNNNPLRFIDPTGLENEDNTENDSISDYNNLNELNEKIIAEKEYTNQILYLTYINKSELVEDYFAAVQDGDTDAQIDALYNIVQYYQTLDLSDDFNIHLEQATQHHNKRFHTIRFAITNRIETYSAQWFYSQTSYFQRPTALWCVSIYVKTSLMLTNIPDKSSFDSPVPAFAPHLIVVF